MKLQPLNPEQIQTLANWRGFSVETCQKLSDRGLIGIVEDNRIALSTKGGVHYRYMKDGKPSWAFSAGAKPSIFAVGSPDGSLAVFESPWDCIAYYDKTGELGIATRGSGNARLAVDYIKKHGIKVAVVVPQNDAPGQKWAHAVIAGVNGNCSLRVMQIPEPHKDLNDFVKAGATGGQIFNAYLDAQPVDKSKLKAEVMAAAGEHGAAAVAKAETGRKMKFSSITQLEMEAIRFVAYPLLQASAFHILVGKKALGKGTFLAGVAARFTRAELGPESNVLWISCGEDSYSLDVKPRLIAAGGVTDNFYYPEGCFFRLPNDVPSLQEEALRIGNVGLIVIDPLSGAMSGTSNSNMDTDVRAAIGPLNDLAARLGCVVIGVRHLKKNISDSGALDSILGSVDFANIPRSVLAISHDDEEDDKRHVGVISGNRVKRGAASRSFRIVGVKVTDGAEVTKAVFLDGPGKDVDTMLKTAPADTKKRKAKMAMLDLLEKASDLNESLESDAVSEQVMEAVGASFQTVKDAKTELKKAGMISFVPDKDENGKLKKWKVRRTSMKRPESLQDINGATATAPAVTEKAPAAPATATSQQKGLF
jgi:hypothetical protein